MNIRQAVLILAALSAAVVGLANVARSNHSALADNTASLYCVGAAKADITPTAAMISAGNFYLGGYGIGPVHPAGSVLRPIYSRAIAIGVPNAGGTCPGAAGDQVVIGADDLQGHFLAYQQGPYGFADMASHIQSTLGIPASHILLQSTHTHNGPDDLGVWGGVPDSYLAEVTSQTESAITQAVGAEQLATVKWATTDMSAYSHPDTTAGPSDNTMRMLQATSESTGAVIATMLNFSTHATIYGPLDEVSPDWPGATASYLEGDQVGNLGTGYPGSVAVVTVGAMGESHPSGVPTGGAAPNGPLNTDNNFPADYYGDAVGYMGMVALASPAQTHVLTGPAQVNGVSSTLNVVNNNPVLLAAIALPVPGYHIYRADTPPYGAGDVLTTEAQMLRVGDLAMMAAPGEPYPSIEFTLSKEISAPVVFPFGLANDQLGYIEQANDYPSAMQCSTTDEGFFTISPTFGNDLETAQRANAENLGFSVTDPGPVADANLPPVPPPTSCTTQQVLQAAQNPAGTVTGALP
ncbi:MAG: hypothetical protein ACYDD4_07830 [Acidimicrobiales bacterium]